ncbi:D123-domain-containing protein [Rhizoctonia solani]|nr:D123-domain-containing protein [Rhizoctonia solani]
MSTTDLTNATGHLFPPLHRRHVLACQTSEWYPTFQRKTIKTTIISGLGEDFRAYLESDGLIIPEGAEDRQAIGELSSDEEMESDHDSGPMARFSFPELDQQIRQAISIYEAVFPKLNWTAPKDASWMLTSSGPLRCTSPADVYLLLKSSDFAMHDLDNSRIFEGCVDDSHSGRNHANNGFSNGTVNGSVPDSSSIASDSGEKDSDFRLELVLKKWYEIERSREVRCFIRDNQLLAISQRDPNFYEHLLPEETRNSIRSTVFTFWNQEVKSEFSDGRVTSYVMDLLLTRDLSRAHIVDFNPYAPRTDPLLFEWSELAELHARAEQRGIESGIDALNLGGSIHSDFANNQANSRDDLPLLRIVTSPNQSARPMYSHNMIPSDALSDNAMRFAAEIAVEMAQREREAQEAEARSER